MKTKITIGLILIGFVWYSGAKPLVSEYFLYKHRLALQINKPDLAEEYILASIRWDENSTNTYKAAEFYASRQNPASSEYYLYKTIENFNGDLTLFALWNTAGFSHFHRGQMLLSKAAYEKALYYWPNFKPAQQGFSAVTGYMNNFNTVIIKLR